MRNAEFARCRHWQSNCLLKAETTFFKWCSQLAWSRSRTKFRHVKIFFCERASFQVQRLFVCVFIHSLSLLHFLLHFLSLSPRSFVAHYTAWLYMIHARQLRMCVLYVLDSGRLIDFMIPEFIDFMIHWWIVAASWTNERERLRIADEQNQGSNKINREEEVNACKTIGLQSKNTRRDNDTN